MSFVGVTIASMTARNTMMNQICYDKVSGICVWSWLVATDMLRKS